MFGQVWDLVFIQPLTQVLVWLTSLTGNLGLAIILLTLLIQLLLLPLRLPSVKSAKKMRNLQPRLHELQKKHKDNKANLAQAQLALYREHGVNPFGGILPTLMSIPVIIALYRVLINTLGETSGIATNFLWLDLSKSDPWYILPIGVGLLQFVLSQQMMASPYPKADPARVENRGTEETMQAVQSQMKYIFPVMSAVITAGLPSGVGLYWIVSVVFAIIQHQTVERWT